LDESASHVVLKIQPFSSQNTVSTPFSSRISPVSLKESYKALHAKNEALREKGTDNGGKSSSLTLRRKGGKEDLPIINPKNEGSMRK
jgi:hypothetical protein